MESGTLSFETRNTAQGIQNPTNDWNPESTAWNPESKTGLDSLTSGAPNVNFWKISVRKTISDLEFSEHLL